MQSPIYLNTLETSGLHLKSLLQELDENFPAFLPQPNDPQSLIMYKSGQRSVVEWISHRLSEESNG
jgi:hypothetical protein